MATKFEFKRSLNGTPDPKLVWGDKTIIANSVTVKVGDAVKIDTDGFIALATAGDKIFGILNGVTDKNGISIEPDAASTPTTYTVASDNETGSTTTTKKKALIDSNIDSLYKNDASGDLTQTMIGQFFDLTDQDQINQGSASDTAGQFQLMELDPDSEDNASMGLFKIAESQLSPYAQQ